VNDNLPWIASELELISRAQQDGLPILGHCLGRQLISKALGGHITGNDFQVNFLVDTGATLISMNKHHAKRIGLNYKIEGEEGLTSTAAGFAKVYRVKLKKVKVGNIELKDVDASVHDGDFPDIILLGNSFLNRLYMSREGRLMKLEKK